MLTAVPDYNRANNRFRQLSSTSFTLQPFYTAKLVPSASSSSVMGSQEPEKTEAAAFGDPFIPGKGLWEGPGSGTGRCHGYKQGELPLPYPPSLPWLSTEVRPVPLNQPSKQPP